MSEGSSRRTFVSSVGKGVGLAALSWGAVAALAEELEAATRKWRGSRPTRPRATGLLVPGPAGVHHGPRDHEPQQRRRLPLAADRDRSARPLPLAAGRSHGVHPVADPRAAEQDDPRGARARVRLRSRGNRDHSQRLGIPGDGPHGDRPPAGRRDPHDEPGLSPHADHAPTARTARGDPRDADSDSGGRPGPGRDHGGVRARHHPPHEDDPDLADGEHHGQITPVREVCALARREGSTRSSTAPTRSRTSPSRATSSGATTSR